MEELFKACTSYIEDFNEISSLKKLPQKPTLINEEAYILNHNLLKEEINEYLDACNANDLKEVADAAGDIFYVLWGLICKHGMQHVFLRDILLPICQSNNTKICKNLSEARESVARYKDQNRDTKFIEINGVYGIFDIQSLKLLKGVNYKGPDIKI